MLKSPITGQETKEAGIISYSVQTGGSKGLQQFVQCLAHKTFDSSRI